MATSHWKVLFLSFLFFSYNNLVKDSLPIKTPLEPIYPQNDIAFAVVLTLTSCMHTGRNGDFNWLQSFQFNAIFEAAKRSVVQMCPLCICNSHGNARCIFFAGGACVQSAYWICVIPAIWWHHLEEFLLICSCPDLSWLCRHGGVAFFSRRVEDTATLATDRNCENFSVHDVCRMYGRC